MEISVDFLVTTVVFAFFAVLTSVISIIFTFLAYAKVVGMEKSTHQVQYVPMESPVEGKELDEKMLKAFGYEDESEDYYGEQ